MASKVSSLTDIGTVTSDDLLYVVDNGGTPASRKATVAELEAAIQSDLRLWNMVRAASDLDVSSNTTPASDSELFFTMAANTMYEFEVTFMYSSPAGAGTPDLKMNFNGPATLTGEAMYYSAFLAVGDTNGSAQPGVALTTVGTAGTATTPRVIRAMGWAYSTGGGSGSSGFVVQWSQNTSSANATRRLAGSSIRYRAIT